LFTFYRSLGINLKQLYGSTERRFRVRATERPGARRHGWSTDCRVEVKIKDSGEILLRSPGLLKEYYKNAGHGGSEGCGGWYHTGDAGFLDSDGHLRIIDRANDVGG